MDLTISRPCPAGNRPCGYQRRAPSAVKVDVKICQGECRGNHVYMNCHDRATKISEKISHSTGLRAATIWCRRCSTSRHFPFASQKRNFNKRKNMNRTQHYSLLKAMEIDKSNLLKYQELYKYAYILSDGIFKIVFAEEKGHSLLISLVNAMLGLQGDDAIKDITLEMQEFPGVFNKKDCILVFFREVLTQLKLRNFIEKDILRLSNGKAVLPC